MAGEGALHLAGLEVPDLEGVVVGGRDGVAAIGGHRHGAHPPCVAGEGALLLASLEVPDLEGEVGGGGDGAAAIWGHRHGAHRSLMAGESALLLAGLEVPDLKGAVRGGGDSAPAVRGHRHGVHCSRVASESAFLLPGLEVPYLEGVILRSGDGAPAVGGHRYGVHPEPMADEGALQRGRFAPGAPAQRQVGPAQLRQSGGGTGGQVGQPYVRGPIVHLLGEEDWALFPVPSAQGVGLALEETEEGLEAVSQISEVSEDLRDLGEQPQPRDKVFLEGVYAAAGAVVLQGDDVLVGSSQVGSTPLAEGEGFSIRRLPSGELAYQWVQPHLTLVQLLRQ